MSEPYFAHPTAVVSEKAKIGEGTKIWHHAQVREGAVIGRNCILGKCAYVDADVRIGSGVKIENRASIFRGVTVEDDVFIGPHVVFTNDKYPRAFSRQWVIVPTLVKRGASIGANCTVICGVTVGEYSMAGAGSVITRDVPPHALVVGNPARLAGYVCRCGNRILDVQQAKKVSRGSKVVCQKCGETTVI